MQIFNCWPPKLLRCWRANYTSTLNKPRQTKSVYNIEVMVLQMWLKNIMEEEYPWGLSHRMASCLKHRVSSKQTKKCHRQCPLGPQTCLRPTLYVFLLLSKRTLHDIIQCLFHNGIFNVWSLLVFLCLFSAYLFLLHWFSDPEEPEEDYRISIRDSAFAQQWLNRSPKLSSLKKYLSPTWGEDRKWVLSYKWEGWLWNAQWLFINTVPSSRSSSHAGELCISWKSTWP